MTARRLQVLMPFLRHPSHILPNLRWRLGPAPSAERHVFVLGAPRSGTTLVQSVLAVHERLGTLPQETGFFTFRDLFSYPFGGFPREELDACRRASRSIVEFYDAFARRALARGAARRFVEKTPQHVLRLRRLRAYFPAAQFVHVFRDGRDCYCSARRQPAVAQNTRVATFARYWRRCVRARLRQGAAGNVYDVPYEALTERPAETVRALMQFLGESFDPRQIDPRFFSPPGLSRARGFERLSEPIAPKSVGRWRRELSRREQRLFERIAGRELRALGYPTGT